ncbi:MAG: hypothetical protein ACREX4_07310 [Gammaproteobacteria bacterium]
MKNQDESIMTHKKLQEFVVRKMREQLASGPQTGADIYIIPTFEETKDGRLVKLANPLSRMHPSVG